MKELVKAFLELIWEIIKMLLWLTLFVILVPIIIPIKILKCMSKACEEEYKKSQEREKQRKIEQQKTINAMNMARDVAIVLSKEKGIQQAIYNDLTKINKLERELGQYKSTQGKLTKNKELLQYVDKCLRKARNIRTDINHLCQLTNKYDTSITMWLQQLDDIEFKLNDSRIACEERIKRLEKKNEKEQMKQYSSDLSAR